MVTRQLFEGMVVTDSVYAAQVDPFVMVTRINFEQNGKMVGYASLYESGDLYCNEEYLPLAVEWLINNVKHRKWFWTRHGTR